MSFVEIIGWIASGLIIISFGIRKMFYLRLVNSIGTLFWIFYGFLRNDPPIIIVNITVVFVHLYWFYQNRKQNMYIKLNSDDV